MGGSLKLRRALPHSPMRLVFCAGVLLALGPSAGSARAAEWNGGLRATGFVGVDSNPARDFAANPYWDVGLSGIAAGEAQVETERALVRGTYEVGGRIYGLHPDASTLVQQGSLQGSWFGVRAFQFSLQADVKDRRGADHPYSDVRGAGRIGYALDAKASLSVEGGVERFVYREYFPYSFGAPFVSGEARYKFDRHHGLTASLGYEPRQYSARAVATPPASGFSGPRLDTVLLAEAGYTYRGPFQLGVRYGYSDQSSNSFGESLSRHSLSVLFGMQLGWQVTLLAQGTLQLVRYPDGVYLSPDLQLADDENTNSVSVRLARPLSKHVDLELRYAFYASELPSSRLHYRRNVGGVGFTWRY